MADNAPLPRPAFAFRRALSVNPIIIPVLSITTGSPVAIDQAALQANGVTAFKMFNPSPYWVWYRGWTGAIGAMPTIKELGHYIAPGMTDINTSQMPQWIAAVAQEEPGWPTANTAGTLTVPARLVMIYGSGA